MGMLCVPQPGKIQRETQPVGFGNHAGPSDLSPSLSGVLPQFTRRLLDWAIEGLLEVS